QDYANADTRNQARWSNHALRLEKPNRAEPNSREARIKPSEIGSSPSRLPAKVARISISRVLAPISATCHDSPQAGPSYILRTRSMCAQVACGTTRGSRRAPPLRRGLASPDFGFGARFHQCDRPRCGHAVKSVRRLSALEGSRKFMHSSVANLKQASPPHFASLGQGGSVPT